MGDSICAVPCHPVELVVCQRTWVPMLRVVPVGAAGGLLGEPRALCGPAAAHSLANKMRYLAISSKTTYHGSSADAIPPYSHCLVHSVCVANAVGALLDIFRPGFIQPSHELLYQMLSTTTSGHLVE